MSIINKDDQSSTHLIRRLKELETTFRQHFVISDWQGIEIIIAVATAHYIKGETLWFRIIGQSRSGKTEILRALAEHQDCAEMEVLTPAAMRGGLKKAPKILDRINKKLVITKDLAPFLTTRNDLRNEIFGLIRSIKDGKLTSDFGSEEGHLEQKAYFDWILATTPVIEQSRQLESLLGERFIDLRWQPGDREEMAYQAGLNNSKMETIRSELSSQTILLLDEAKIFSDIKLSDTEIKIISELADKAATLRTPVPRDRERNIYAYPEPEIGTELTQGFCRIVQGLKKLGIDKYGPYINRLVWDSMPKIRAVVMTSLVSGAREKKEIANITKLSEGTVGNILQDLKLLGVIDKNNELCMQLHI